ncbi:bifunctional diguanylate cyclase/phosphodiesterase [Simiduia sp. 21SJ11W-1]|uniref:sensor domain-containing protein n=1 Tax=Simiduia sp. 21SJ11W-1 TaxID=2909669 RepID=UPI00209DA61F|nr:bifunctional diguanylate cyclase/phosphodiesterase [Simiduia sp. 21SJ11W-1]UTA47698.1 bifunctional diguanylate cyclase/phosphodiesterase [Simiduia sp. 21SJ11W-1]
MQQLLEAAFHQSHQPQCLLDGADQLLTVNHAYLALIGEQATPKDSLCPFLNPNLQGPAMVKSIKDAIARKGWWEGELPFQHRARSFQSWVSIKRLQTPTGNNLLVSFSDISERKLAEVKLQRLAYFDGLTQLPNLSLLLDRLNQAQMRAKRSNQLVAVVLFEPDHADNLRADLGSTAFDETVVAMSQRVGDILRAQDTLAALGHGRFALLMPDLPDKRAALNAFTQIADKLQVALRQKLPNLQQGLSAAVGAALFPLDAVTPQTHLKQAETALLQAKRRGRGQSLLFTPALQQQASARQQMAKEMQRAIEHNDFLLHYQPVLDANDGTIVGVEALLRWAHAERGLLLPEDFLEAAEATGCLKVLGGWVFRESAKQFLRWRNQGVKLSTININISVSQFQSPLLVAQAKEILTETGIDPANVVLEITEAALTTDNFQQQLTQLRALGLKLALDDFGAGPSSLLSLHTLPFSQIKLNRAFTQGLPAEKPRKQLQGLATYLHTLGFEVVLTGVETPVQLEVAQRIDCQCVQGYLLREPASAADLNLRPPHEH